jgi:hypothetical protein
VHYREYRIASTFTCEIRSRFPQFCDLHALTTLVILVASHSSAAEEASWIRTR